MANLNLEAERAAPCPLCGSEQVQICRDANNPSKDTCRCRECKCTGPLSTWNRRSADASGAVELTPLPPSRHKASDFEGWARVYTDHEVDNIRRAAVAADRRARGVPAVAGMSQQPAPAASIGDDFEFHRLLNHVCEASEELEAATGKLVFVAVDKLTSAKSALIAHIDAKLAEARGEMVPNVNEPNADWRALGYVEGATVRMNIAGGWAEYGVITCAHGNGALDVSIKGRTYGWSARYCDVVAAGNDQQKEDT